MATWDHWEEVRMAAGHLNKLSTVRVLTTQKSTEMNKMWRSVMSSVQKTQGGWNERRSGERSFDKCSPSSAMAAVLQMYGGAGLWHSRRRVILRACIRSLNSKPQNLDGRILNHWARPREAEEQEKLYYIEGSRSRSIHGTTTAHSASQARHSENYRAIADWDR